MLTKSDIKIIDELLQKRLQDGLQNGLKPIKRDLCKIRQDLEMVTGEFDEEQIKLKKRVDRIESHLHISQMV